MPGATQSRDSKPGWRRDQRTHGGATPRQGGRTDGPLHPLTERSPPRERGPGRGEHSGQTLRRRPAEWPRVAACPPRPQAPLDPGSALFNPKTAPRPRRIERLLRCRESIRRSEAAKAPRRAALPRVNRENPGELGLVRKSCRTCPPSSAPPGLCSATSCISETVQCVISALS